MLFLALGVHLEVNPLAEIIIFPLETDQNLSPTFCYNFNLYPLPPSSTNFPHCLSIPNLSYPSLQLLITIMKWAPLNSHHVFHNINWYLTINCLEISLIVLSWIIFGCVLFTLNRRVFEIHSPQIVKILWDLSVFFTLLHLLPVPS